MLWIKAMIATKWIVITGGPCSGKTTLINALHERGFDIAHEVARSYLEELVDIGFDLTDIKSSMKLQKKILSLKIEREQHCDISHRVFFDRGIPDSFAYFKLHHLNIDAVLGMLPDFRYQKVFFLESLPLVNDDIRNEDLEVVVKLNHLIFESYKEQGYELIKVPPISVSKRLDFVLSQID